MKQLDSIIFKDTSFPVTILTHRTSTLDNIDTAKEALHEAIEIKYFYEGKSTLLVGEKTVQAEAGDIIIINPYEIHATIDYGKEKKGKYCLIMIGLDFFDGLIGADINLRHMVFGKRAMFKTHIKANRRMQEIMARIMAEKDEERPASKLALIGLIAELFALLLRDGIDEGEISSNVDMVRYYPIIEPAIRMIRDEYASKSFTVDILASACNISKYHFCRIFKAATGQSAINYLNSYRLKIANNMLKSTNKSVNEIALLCGFEDASYFCKLYKREFGITPKSCKSAND